MSDIFWKLLHFSIFPYFHISTFRKCCFAYTISYSICNWFFLLFEFLGMGIVLWIVMFMSLVLLHELGHFITAKRSGVKVLEFGIGIPPKVCKLRTDKSGTVYTLNLLPLGGFVKLKGEDPTNHADFHAKDSFITAKLRKKIIILLAGVGMNFLVARALFSFIFWQWTKPISILPENAFRSDSQSYLIPTFSFLEKAWFTSGSLSALPAKVSEVLPQNIASDMGIKPGDTILSINGEKINVINIGMVLRNRIGKTLEVSYQRGKKTLIGRWMCAEDDCILWVSFTIGNDVSIKQIKFPLGRAIVAGLQEIGAETKLTLNALGTLWSNLLSFDKHKIKTALSKLTGPVGAVKLGETLLKEWGRKLYLGFAGLISLALAIFNVIPLPALDGWRLLGVLIQWIGRLKPEKYFTIENYINVVFFVLLMTLGVYIILTDLIRFWWVHIPFLS